MLPLGSKKTTTESPNTSKTNTSPAKDIDIEDTKATETPKKTWAQTAYNNKGTIAAGLIGATALGVGGAALLGAFGGGGTSGGAQPPSNPAIDQSAGGATKTDTQTGQLQTPNGLSQILSGNIQQRSLISESVTENLNQLQQDMHSNTTLTDTLPHTPSSFLKTTI
jgi:hypothetical protein